MNKKILIVDDEPDVVSYLNAFLNDNGFDTISAKNGKECFAIAKSEKPDLITLDITMPEESGVRAFRNLKECKETKNIPVIIITGVTTDFQEFLGSRKNIEPPAAYFEKPIDRNDFLKKVLEIFKL
ncbi:response regulator [Bacteroidetes/Chlorobi group bacterium ChocPot_Mid]|jgi:DNA-binding response OmpR family regulator|nr:MAG: response regulator [Bacteroidetes/Chlorobi group bacterium ChocPot_Mid]